MCPMISLLSLRAAVASLVVCTASAAVAGMLAPGDPFPSWTLPDQKGNPVSSSDLRGSRYVLWYYPKAMTPGCTVEGNAFRDSHASFEAEGIRVFGVSFDTPQENAAFARAQSFPFPLLSDVDRELGIAVGAARSSEQDHAQRISYLVGGDGTVLKAYDQVSPADHARQVLEDAADR